MQSSRRSYTDESFSAACNYLELVFEEQGFGSSRVSAVWTSPTETYFKIILATQHCPICDRTHEKPQAFYSQYFSVNTAESSSSNQAPRAYIGCLREKGAGISKQTAHVAGAEDIRDMLLLGYTRVTSVKTYDPGDGHKISKKRAVARLAK